MNTSTILFVTDNAEGTARAMRATLTVLGHHTVISAMSVEEALAIIPRESPDLVLIDSNMGGMGLLNLRTIREASVLPIIVLSDHSAERDKVEALDAGADDYIIKPCGIHELLARIRAAVRRAPSADCGLDNFVDGDLTIDFIKRRATIAGNSAHLSPKEHDVLRFLVSHPNRPVSHRKLLNAVWGSEYGSEHEYLRTIIRNLRLKIEKEPSAPKYLRTEPSVGYWFATTC